MASSERGGLSAAELETAGRLILADLPVRVVAGPWWGYHPAEATVTYPNALLSEWPMEKLVAALSHEVAEARFTGEEGARLVARWIERVGQRGLSPSTLGLLVNTVNDMRVNRLQMERYPAVRRLLELLYREHPGLEQRADLPGPAAAQYQQPLHHQYVDGLIYAWTEREWPGSSSPPKLAQRVRRALRQTASPALRAAEQNSLADVLETLEIHVLRSYEALVLAEREGARRASRARLRRAAPDEPDRAETSGKSETEPAARPPSGAPALDSAEVRPEQDEPADGPPTPTQDAESAARAATSGPTEPPPTPQPQRPSQRGVRRHRRRTPATEQIVAAGGEPCQRGLSARTREDEGRRIDYERFDYLAAVRELEPLIRGLIYGDGRRPGLADIMNRRRHGSVDPWRRPRLQRSGDAGEVDTEHPDRLVTDPSVAFLKGVRIARTDRQRDFANAILLDISGSMVQRGFPTRKFDRLVEAAVIFVEIHERLKIPYEVLSFSSDTVVHWRFDQCKWTTLRIDAPEAYRPQDHSRMFRRVYGLEHRDTDDAGALRVALRDTLKQRGLKSVLVVTDGISSDPAELRRVLSDIERRNRNVPEEQRLKVLAFGVGVVRSEFESAYVPREQGKALRSSMGAVVEDTAELPALIRNAVDQRIRYA